MLGWRNKKPPTAGATFQAPSGYRDSDRAIFSDGEVVANAYQVRKLLGTSTSGQVFEAWDMLLERLVALKAGWRDADSPPLLSEARALSAVSDDGVVRIHGMGHHHGIEYVVMEAVSGQTVAERIAQCWDGARRMSIDEGLRILLLVADGLAAVHGAGLAHRDLRPENILYPEPGRIVFSGLGLPAAPRDASRPPAMAPEIIAHGLTNVDLHRVDLYCYGALAVEVLTGAPPYHGKSLQETLDAHVHDAVPDVCALRPELPTEIADLVFELLAKEPNRRPHGAAEVAAQLRVIRARLEAKPRRDTVKVLLVDDDAGEVRRLWSRIRRAHARVEVEAAPNATDAIAAIRRDPPQVILFSMELPGSMNGFELAMYLQGSGDARRSIFVAMVDARNDGSDGLLDQLGVAQVLERGPAMGDHLSSTIRRLAEQILHGSVPVVG